MVCIEKEKTEFGKFLGFETLTLCPIDTRMISLDLLSPKEIQWINNYHQKVYDELSPLLSDEMKVFLHKKTRPV